MEVDIKKLTVIFGTCVAGIVVCFGMSVYTAIQESHQKKVVETQVVPVPAINQ
jgi:hypothetical protein